MSGFTIPNTPDAFNQNQAEPDSLDFQVLGNQVNGVVSGMAVTPGSLQTVNVASGEVLIGGAYYPYTGTSVSLTSYASSNFFDIIVARINGSTITCYALAGPTGTNPRFPTTVNLDTDVVLASVWRTGSSAPSSSAITDKRVFVRSNAVRTASDTISANRGSTADIHVNTAWTPSTTSTTSPLSVKVGSTWYNIAYWAPNTNISTSGTITAGNFIGTFDGYDTAVLETGNTIAVRDSDGSIRASYITANSVSGISTFGSVLAGGVSATSFNAFGLSSAYYFSALTGGTATDPDYTWSSASTTGMYLGVDSGHIGFTRAGSLKLTVTSSGIYVNGTVGSSSSIRFKENIIPAVIDKDDLLNIELVTYTLKESPTNPPSVGIIAEELEKLDSCKQFIYYDADGNAEAVMYDRLTLAYIELLKDHEVRLQALENGAN